MDVRCKINSLKRRYLIMYVRSFDEKSPFVSCPGFVFDETFVILII